MLVVAGCLLVIFAIIVKAWRDENKINRARDAERARWQMFDAELERSKRLLGREHPEEGVRLVASPYDWDIDGD